MRIPTTVTAAATLAALLATGLSACGRGGSAPADPDTVSVVAAFYPLQFVAERVGGDAVTVTNLAAPGTEPHDLELTLDQVRQIADATLVVYLRGFQPAVDETVDQQAEGSSFDVAGVQPLRDAPGGASHESEGASEGGGPVGKDPHVWLDPTRLATIAVRLADRLGAAEPGRAADFRSRAAALRTELEGLDREYADGLRSCQRHEIVTSHAAFGYLAERYRVDQISISGLSPETEPSPQRLADVAREAREHGTTTIFFETLVSPRVAETLAQEVGAKAEVLDPIEGLRPGTAGDYFSLMRANLGRLRAALGCQ